MPVRTMRLIAFLTGVFIVQATSHAADAPGGAASERPPIRVQAGGGAEPGNPLPPPPITADMAADAMTPALDRYLGALAAKDEFSGAVLVAKAGSAVFVRPYGLANIDAKVANTAATRFNVGSIGKFFTKVAIGQLIEKGKLNLTSTIGEILPDYPNPDGRVATVDQLLNHSAGIANFFSPEFAVADKSKFRSNDDYYRFVASRPLTFAPGTRTEYCNGCYVVLGAIVERISGMPYENYIAENVFKPAGMTGAAFIGSDSAGAAIGYTRFSDAGLPVEGAPLRDNRNQHGARGSAAGGSYAQVSDLLAFDNALREYRLLGRSMTAWFLDASPDASATGARMGGRYGVRGGAPGVNAILVSNGTWAVVVEANRDMPIAVRVGEAIMRQLAPP
jgi:CubicO group peptidase (beta-lactamase class C family)